MQEKLSSPMAYMKNVCAKIQTIWMWVILLECTLNKKQERKKKAKQERKKKAKQESQKKAKQVTASLQWWDNSYFFEVLARKFKKVIHSNERKHLTLNLKSFS